MKIEIESSSQFGDFENERKTKLVQSSDYEITNIICMKI